MVNKVRGEVEIEINGTKYLLKPEFSGLCAVEDMAGKGLNAIASEFASGTVGIKTVASIVFGGMIGAENDSGMTFQKLGNEVRKHGMNKLIKPLTEFLKLAMNLESKEDAAGKQEATPVAAASSESVAGE